MQILLLLYNNVRIYFTEFKVLFSLKGYDALYMFNCDIAEKMNEG